MLVFSWEFSQATLFPCPFPLQTDVTYCSHPFTFCVRSQCFLELQRREAFAMEEYVCYQLASKKCKGYFLELALPGQVFPFENPNSTYLPSRNNFLVCESFPQYYLPLDFNIANGLFLVYLKKKFCFPTKSFCILVKKRSYLFIVFPTFLNVILQKISIMSAQGDEDVTFFQVKSLNCLQFFFLFYGKKLPFPLNTPQLTLPYIMQSSSFSGYRSTYSSNGFQFSFRA